MYYFHHQYFNAINECRKALEIDPNFVLTPKYLRDIYLMKEDEKSAVEWHIKFMTLSGTLPDDIADYHTKKTADDYFTKNIVEPLQAKGILHEYYDDGVQVNCGSVVSQVGNSPKKLLAGK